MMAGIASSAGRRARRSRASATPPEATTTTGRALCWREARSGFRNRPTRGVLRPPVNRRHSRHRARRGVRRARGLTRCPPGETTTGRSPRGVCFPARFRRALDARRGRARVRPRPGDDRSFVPSLESRGRVHPGRSAPNYARTIPIAPPPRPLVPPRRTPTPPDAPATPTRSARTPTPPRARAPGPRRRPIHAFAARRDSRPRRRRAARPWRTATVPPTITPTNTLESIRPPSRRVRPPNARRARTSTSTRRRRRRRLSLGSGPRPRSRRRRSRSQ